MTRLQRNIQAAIRWGQSQKVLGLSDWNISVHVSNVPPPWFADDEPRHCHNGAARWVIRRKHGDIWVSPDESADDKTDPLAVAFHELSHIHFADLGISNDTNRSPFVEFAHDRMAAIMLMAYRSR